MSLKTRKHRARHVPHLQDDRKIRKVWSPISTVYHAADCLPPWVVGITQVSAFYDKALEALEKHLSSQFRQLLNHCLIM